MSARVPVIGITTDLTADKFTLNRNYVDAVVAAGARPVLLAPVAAGAEGVLDFVDGLVFTGGDDADMQPFGKATHPKAVLIDPLRQSFETALMVEARRLERPVLGICWGMQLMALCAGGDLDQHLPDHLETALEHQNNSRHAIRGAFGTGDVTSSHHQAVALPGDLEVAALAHDGVIEAVVDPRRPFFLGVQWHPERTVEDAFGRALFRRLVAAAEVRR